MLKNRYLKLKDHKKFNLRKYRICTLSDNVLNFEFDNREV